MRAGRLSTQVTIEQRVTGSPQQSATGEPNEAWGTYATVWADVQPMLGRERVASQQVQSEVDTKIRVRWMRGVTDAITAAMRVNASGVIYNINAPVNVNNRNREWLLYCAAGMNNG